MRRSVGSPYTPANHLCGNPWDICSVARSGRDADPDRILDSRIRSKLYHNLRKFARIHWKFSNFEDLSSFFRIFGETPWTVDQNRCKIRWESLKIAIVCIILRNNPKTFHKNLLKLMTNFESGAVQRIANLVVLEKINAEKCVFGCKNRLRYSRKRAL